MADSGKPVDLHNAKRARRGYFWLDRLAAVEAWLGTRSGIQPLG